jgi:hypothetical protein
MMTRIHPCTALFPNPGKYNLQGLHQAILLHSFLQQFVVQDILERMLSQEIRFES